MEASSHVCYQYALLITHVKLQAYHEMAAFLTEQGTMLTRKRVVLEQSWRENFVDPSRSSKDLFKVQH